MEMDPKDIAPNIWVSLMRDNPRLVPCPRLDLQWAWRGQICPHCDASGLIPGTERTCRAWIVIDNPSLEMPPKVPELKR